MTGDEAVSPVRALRGLPATEAGASPAGPKALRVELEGSIVDVLLRLSADGRKYDNLLILGEESEGTAEALAVLLPLAQLVAPTLDDLGAPQHARQEQAVGAQAVVELLDHFSIDRVVLIGTERGAELAVSVAASHPDRIGALVLVNGGLGRFPNGGPAGEREVDAAADESTLSVASAGEDDVEASVREALAGLRVPVALLFGGAVADARGYTPASVRATTSWLRHVDAQHVAAAEPERFDEQVIVLVADIVETQLASVRARAAHPATGSHRVILPADDEN